MLMRPQIYTVKDSLIQKRQIFNRKENEKQLLATMPEKCFETVKIRR